MFFWPLFFGFKTATPDVMKPFIRNPEKTALQNYYFFGYKGMVMEKKAFSA